jgi:hypothetical protein
MQLFHYPSKQTETVFCRRNQKLRDCVSGHGFDPERLNLPLEDTLEVKQSSLGEKAGRGVFAKVDIPQNSYVGLEKLIPIIHGSPQTYDLMVNWHKRIPWVAEWWEMLETYTDGYGHIFSYNVCQLCVCVAGFHLLLLVSYFYEILFQPPSMSTGQ